MQPDGTLAPLKNRGIDTGIGLERLAMVLEGKRTLFESGAFRPIIARVEEMTGRPYEGRARSGLQHHRRPRPRAHLRPGRGGHARATRGAATSSAASSAAPRSQGHRLGLTEPFLADLSGLVVEMMGGAYPELREAAPAVRMALQLEEERFGGHPRAGALPLRGGGGAPRRVGHASRARRSSSSTTPTVSRPT